MGIEGNREENTQHGLQRARGAGGRWAVKRQK